MTTPQIAATVIVMVTLAWVYGRPLLNKVSLPGLAKPSHSLLDQVSDVIDIREAHPTPAVKQACNALLEALLKVGA